MPLDTVDSLIDALRGRPILLPEQFEQLSREHGPAHSDTQKLAQTLVKLRWLTVYQAKKLIAGKGDELIVGPFVILDKLGEGGMGKVYKATQLRLGRVVALKVVRGSLLKNEIALKRFQREVRAAAQMNHPNIVRVFEADQLGDRHFLVMEHIAGMDLARMVKERGPLPIGMACSVVRQAALGLQSAHDLGFIHRDIKPSNLLIGSDLKGQFTVRSVVKILDMGLARPQLEEAGAENLSTELTRTGTVVGTPEYMSPEQAKNSSAVDHRSDLYSLGCTFFYLLTGEPPFPTGTPLEKLLQHQMDAPRPVQMLRMEIPPEVATIVQTLLAKRPEGRFQSGAALANALEPWCSGEGNSTVHPALVPHAEAVDPSSATLETIPNDPFDFGADGGAATPEATRGPPPLPRSRPRPNYRKPKGFKWLIAAAALLAAALLIGAVAIGIALATRKKSEEPSPGTQEPPKTDPKQPPAKSAKADPPPAKDLEVVEKFLPNDSALVCVFEIKQWQAFAPTKQFVFAPLSERLGAFHRATGVDLLAVVERVIVGLGPDDKSAELVVLQGRSLVTPRLLDGVKAMPGVATEPAWLGGPELLILGPQVGAGRLFAGTSETCVFLSSSRDRIVEALEKRDGKRKTKLADPTIERGLEVGHARPFAAFATMGLHSGWARSQPAASKLNFVAAGIMLDDKGMQLHTLGSETEVGKTAELQKAFGKMLADKAKESNPPSVRIQRLANLFLEGQPSKSPQPGVRLTHLFTLVPIKKLEEWFAPFFAE
jgi:eukaryotic-like serine/threonine-protein kinase